MQTEPVALRAPCRFSGGHSGYNRAGQIRQLDPASPRPNRFQIVVVDDGSADDTAGVVRRWASAYPLHPAGWRSILGAHRAAPKRG